MKARAAGRVIREIEAAAGVSTDVDQITEVQARDLKPVLRDVTDTIGA
jgi:hypothetical protein